MRKPSITLQLTLLFALSSTAILLVVGGVLGILIHEHFEMEDVAELEGRIARVQPVAGGVVNATPGITIAPALLTAEPRTADGLGTTPPMIWKAEGGRTIRGIAHRLARERDGRHTTVVAALDISHHVSFLEMFRLALGASALLGIAFSVLLGWIAARRGMAPLRQLARLAGNVSAERLAERLPVERVPAELTALASTFNDMLGRLEDSFRRLSEFSSDLAHEMRTPITNVMTQTQVALSRARASEDYREVLYSNLEEFQRLARIVEDMLFLARSDHGLELPEKVAVDLAREADGLIEYFEPMASEGGVELVRKGEALAQGDRLMVRRALANLLSNAIRHTDPGGSVTIALSQAGATARAHVENPGADIPAEHLTRIFDRFHRVDPSRGSRGGGSGLGLSITKAIAKAHRGEISATSAGGLTRFTLSLPAAR